MKKISTLFKKDPQDLGRVINEVDPQNQWVINGEGVATRKFDGTAAAVINGVLYKRYDVKKGKSVPFGAIPCQEPDAITGHWPHWVRVSADNPADKWFFQALDNAEYELLDGTYELCGPNVQGNPEGFLEHVLVKHGTEPIYFSDYSFENIKRLIDELPYEGIVFHHPDGRMCKIRKSDFGLKL
jgi:hypothetical protein